MKSLVKIFVAIIVVIFLGDSMLRAADQPASKKVIQYQCIPCGYDCDKDIYDKPGNCKSCKMKLVNKSTVSIKNIQPNELCNYIKTHPGIVLLDVRTKEEFEGKADPNFGGLRNSINLPVQELESKIATINQLKNKEIIVFCSHSHRSPMATYLLMQHGFTNVKNMAGGMSVMTDKNCIK